MPKDVKRKHRNKGSYKPKSSSSFKRKNTNSKSSSSSKSSKSSNSKKSVLKGKPRKVGTNHWLTVFNAKPGKMPKWLKYGCKMTEKSNYNITSAFQILNTPGTQAFDGLSANVYSPYDIANFITPGVQSKNEPIVLLNCKAKLFGTNQTNANQFIDIYELKARHDVYGNIGGIGNGDNPDIIMRTTQFEDTANDCFQIGFTPFEKRTLTEAFKIQNVTRYNLSSGESFEHMFTQTPNLKFDVSARNTIVQATSVNHGMFEKLTTYIMIIQWGAPYNDVTTKTQVSTGGGTVDYVFTKKYTTCPINANYIVTNKFTNNLPAAFTVAQDNMELDGDVKANVVA